MFRTGLLEGLVEGLGSRLRTRDRIHCSIDEGIIRGYKRRSDCKSRCGKDAIGYTATFYIYMHILSFYITFYCETAVQNWEGQDRTG